MVSFSKSLSTLLLATLTFAFHSQSDGEIHKLKLPQRVKLSKFILIGKVEKIEGHSARLKKATLAVEKSIKGLLLKEKMALFFNTKPTVKSIELKVGQSYLFFIKKTKIGYQCVNYKHGALLVAKNDKAYKKTLQETLALCKKQNCPKCLSDKNVVPIIYGYPSEGLMKAAEKGLVELGGCISRGAEKYCRACKKSW